jgi:hypothetical protein
MGSRDCILLTNIDVDWVNIGGCEAQNLPRCNAVFLIECLPTFQSTCCLHHRPDDGGSTYLWNVGRHSIKNTAVHPRRFWASYSPPWELEMSHWRVCLQESKYWETSGNSTTYTERSQSYMLRTSFIKKFTFVRTCDRLETYIPRKFAHS